MKDDVKRELDALAEKTPGVLKGEHIVQFVEANPSSALRGEFEWNNDECGRLYRLQQANNLIRAYVTVLPQTLQRVRGFLSVPTDRANGGGYRRTEDVLRNDALRRQMVEDVLKRVEGMRTSIAHLPELQPVFAEIGVAVARFRASQVGVAAAA